MLFALLAIAGVLAALLLTQRPYRVVGRSMEPALVEGDWLRLERAAPRAGDMVVFREPDSGGLAVKRVAATPGETVQIVGPDLWVGGAMRARPLSGITDLVPMLDARGGTAQPELDLESAGFRAGEGAWRLESGPAQAFLRHPPRASYLLRDRQVPQPQPAGELGVEAEIGLLGPGAEAHVHLRLGRATFTASLTEGGRRSSLVRREPEREPQLLHEASFDPPATSGRLFFCVVDRRLTMTWNGRRLVDGLVFEPPEPVVLADGPADLGLRAHAGVGGVGPMEFRRLRIGRDLIYDPSGTYGGAQGFHLGPDEYFLLGDNPASSRDSRQYGAVDRERILGVVRGRLWPRGWSGWGWPGD